MTSGAPYFVITACRTSHHYKPLGPSQPTNQSPAESV
jgi:hypothetical protein